MVRMQTFSLLCYVGGKYFWMNSNEKITTICFTQLINLAYESPMDDEICWLVSQYCFYVYEQKKMKAHNYTIDVDKLRKHLKQLYVLNQWSQNVLAYIPF